jgi:hypothetical protein
MPLSDSSMSNIKRLDGLLEGFEPSYAMSKWQ